MKKLIMFAAVGALAVPLVSQAGITAFTSVATEYSSYGASTLDMTTEGNLDWGYFFAPDGGGAFETTDKPYESKAGGTGFTSLELIGGATWDTGNWGNGYNARNYTWTDGTVLGTGGSLDYDYNGRVATSAGTGAGTRLTIDVAEAGDYTLTYYAATLRLGMDATATLASEGSDYVENGPAALTGFPLVDYTITVDFTTTGADTLTLDVVNSSYEGTPAYALEGFTLSGTVVPEPATIGLLGVFGTGLVFFRRKLKR